MCVWRFSESYCSVHRTTLSGQRPGETNIKHATQCDFFSHSLSLPLVPLSLAVVTADANANVRGFAYIVLACV